MSEPVLRLSCRLRGWAVLALLAASLACVGRPPAPERIVAVGDVHGADETALRVLRAVGLVDAESRWSGGTAVLVQVGDLIDRGRGDRDVLELFMRLEDEARLAGGRVVVLLGNHEIMNLHGDLRYVAREAYAHFAEAGAAGSGPADKPPGYAAHRAAFAPDGRYGRWLRSKSAVTRIGDIVFAHGGIHPEIAKRGVRQINRQIRAELELFDAVRGELVGQQRIGPLAELDEALDAARKLLEEGDGPDRARLERFAQYPNWLCAHPTGPTWFRGLAQWSDDELAAQLPEALERLGAQHIVVGHTPQLGTGIVKRQGGAVFLIDTGMLDGPIYPGGSGYALEIADGRFTSIDERGRRVVLHSRPDAARRHDGSRQLSISLRSTWRGSLISSKNSS